MKTAFRALTLISAISIVLLLANCSKDGDPAPDDVIVGKWTITTSNVTVTVGSQSLVDFFISEDGKTPEQAQSYADAFEADYDLQGGSMEFKNDGTYSFVDQYGDGNAGAWELSSDRKTLTMQKGTPSEGVLTVATLTSSNLNMSMDFSYDYKESVFTIHLDLALTK